jgi:WD40 repeat protein
VVCRFGVPLVIITDNGSHFKGEFTELCSKLGIQHRFATPYHPQTTGQDERTNGLLLGRIRKWRLQEYKKWDEDLLSSIFACNTRKVSTTSFSPIETLMGYTASTSSTLHIRKLSKRGIKKRLELLTHHSQNVAPIRSRIRLLETLRDEAIRIRDVKTTKMKERYDKKTRPQTFQEGQEVLLYDSSLLKQWSRKLEERWNGPYVVLWSGERGAYTIDLGQNKTRTVSGDHLKAYHRR